MHTYCAQTVYCVHDSSLLSLQLNRVHCNKHGLDTQSPKYVPAAGSFAVKGAPSITDERSFSFARPYCARYSTDSGMVAYTIKSHLDLACHFAAPSDMGLYGKSRL